MKGPSGNSTRKVNVNAGELTVGGPLKPFKSDAGLIAVEGAIPVVPMKVKVNRLSWIDQRGPGTSPRGDVEVVFGTPLRFPARMDANQATAQLEQALTSSRTIGAAIGILMASRDVDQVEALRLLRQASSRSNTPMRDLAEVIVADRRSLV